MHEMGTAMKRPYTVFQKLWYLMVVLVVIGLAVTGFEIHGTYRLSGYRVATLTHDALIFMLLLLGAVYVFWLWVTDRETRHSLRDMTAGQRNVNLGLIFMLWVVMAASGALYIGFVLFHEAFAANVNRAVVAYVHTAGAFLVGALAIWHFYLTYFANGKRQPG